MPIYVGVGKSTNKDYRIAAAEVVSQAKRNLEQKAISLAIVFSTPEFASRYLLEAISNFIGPDVPLVGATSNAICTTEGILNHGVAMVLMTAKEAYFNTAIVKNALSDLYTSGTDLGNQLLFGMKEARRRFCLVLSDGSITDNLPFLKGLQQKLGLSFPIIGANTASDSIQVNKSSQFFNQEALHNSIVGLLWAGKINFGLGIKHGWKPIGKPRQVTQSDNTVIKEIENKPAVSLYQDYFAKDIPQLQKELKRISCLYPLGINIPGEEEYLLRNILSIGDDGSLICREHIPDNSQVRLMIGNKESCLAATEEAAREARQALATKMLPRRESIRIIFVFNSVSRRYIFGRQINKELDIIKANFPGKPIIGLATYGEQAPLKATDFAGKTYCHNQTTAILAVS